MRTLGKIVAALGVVSAIGVAGAVPASVFEVYVGPRHHHYYNYYGGWHTGKRLPTWLDRTGRRL
jgi:hypothetical protein